MNAGRFKKGNTPWNKELKGIHLSPESEFKKGRKAWNKGKIQKGFDGKTIDALHEWVYRNLGNPKRCDNKKCSKKSKHYEWSNISGKYKQLKSDWQRLCKPCHHLYDFEKFGARKEFYKR